MELLTGGGSICSLDLLQNLQDARCFEDALEHLQQLSSNGEGSVTLCRCRRSGQRVVVKAYPRHGCEQVLSEIRIHSSLCPSPHISSFLAAVQDCSRTYLLLDHAEGGDLREHMQRLDEAQLRDMVVQPLLGALVLLQDRGIVHRDIKPENLLLHRDRVLLSDFGLAVCRRPAPPHDLLAGGRSCGSCTGPAGGGMSNDNGHYGSGEPQGACSRGGTGGGGWGADGDGDGLSACGTLLYTAPEVLLALFQSRPVQREVGPGNDVWALVVLLLEALAGRHPFSPEACQANGGNVMYSIAYHKRLVLPEHLRPELKDFLSKALQRDPDARLSARQLQQHPWMHCQLPGAAAFSEPLHSAPPQHGDRAVSVGGVTCRPPSVPASPPLGRLGSLPALPNIIPGCEVSTGGGLPWGARARTGLPHALSDVGVTSQLASGFEMAASWED